MSNRWFQSLGAAYLATVATGLAQNTPNWRVYKAADGLPESIISSVNSGPHGQVWIRYLNSELISSLDGYDIKTMTAPGLANNRVYPTPGNQIWTVFAEGLSQYRGNEWVSYPLRQITAELRQESRRPSRLVSLCPLKRDHALFLLSEGLMELNTEAPEAPKTTLFRAADQTPLQKFSRMAVARDGGLWITGDRGLAKVKGPIRNMKPGSEWQYHVLNDELRVANLREPVEDDEGGVTALGESLDGKQQVLARFDGQQWTVTILTGERLTQAWRGENRDYWATTTSSLYQWEEGKTGMVANEEISAHRYYDLLVEPKGVFWLATSDGLFRHAPLAWRSPPEIQSLNTLIHALCGDQEDRLWVATVNSLHLLQNNQWKTFPFPRETTRESQSGRAVFPLGNGTVVTEAGTNLLQFNPGAEQFNYFKHPPEARLRPIGLLRDGSLCVQVLSAESSRESYRLEVFNGTNFSPFPHPQPGPEVGNDLIFLSSPQNGNLWLSGNKGLAWYHDDKWQVSFGPGDGTLPEGPACMAEMGEGRIWCGVQDRLWEFDGKAWSLVKSGFDRVNALLKASDGSVWVAANNGLHHYYRGAWVVNGAEEGLPSDAVREIHEDHRGRIWAGTTHGLSLYHPEADPDPPRTFVHNLADPRNRAPEGDTVNISFGGQDKWKYTPADRLLFSHRLDQQEWSAYQEDRSVSFSDLAAGEHYFQVRAMDRNGNIDPKPALLEFAITLPWYKERRLLLISFTGLGFAVFFAALAFNRHLQLVRSYAEVEAKVALRTKQLELANQELLQSQKMNALGTLAAGIAHDFNNILSIIKGSAQIIEDNLENREKIRTRADRIKTVVEQGAGIVKAMLGFSRSSDQQLELCDVRAVVEETIKLLGDRFLREIEVQFEAGPRLPQVPASKGFIQQILLNLLFNAAEAMTGSRRVILGVAQSDHLPPKLALAPVEARSFIFISVRDFGCGIAPDILPRIFEPFFTTKAFSARRGTGLGLSMVYELARQMNCGLAVESMPGQGSIFSLIIPVRELPTESSPHQP